MPVSRACRCCRRRSSSSCSATTSRRVAGMLDTGWTHSDRSSVHSLHTQTSPAPTQSSTLSGDNPVLPLVCQFLMQCHHLETRGRHAWTHSDRSSVHSLHTQTPPGPTQPSILSGECGGPLLPSGVSVPPADRPSPESRCATGMLGPTTTGPLSIRYTHRHHPRQLHLGGLYVCASYLQCRM